MIDREIQRGMVKVITLIFTCMALELLRHLFTM